MRSDGVEICIYPENQKDNVNVEEEKDEKKKFLPIVVGVRQVHIRLILNIMMCIFFRFSHHI